MKKILSVLLVAAMLVTTLVVATIPVSAAGEGDWSVYGLKAQELDDDYSDKRDIPGYTYTEEGLKMIPSTWKDSTPYGTVQTTDPVYLKDGIYLQVRVDEFSYGAGDMWFAFSIWDDQNIQPGNVGGEWGLGVETLIRVKGANDPSYNVDDQNTWPGAMAILEWYKDLEEDDRVRCWNTEIDDQSFVNEFDENGCPILTLKVVWDSDSETYAVYINGVPAPDSYNQAVTDYFGTNADSELGDDMAYVGFSLQNNQKGGTIGCTVLKYGPNEEDAEPPQGNDERDPEEFTNKKADIADPSEVPEGEPAIILNGSRSDSNVANKPSGGIINEDNSINLTSNSDNFASVRFLVDNSVSYDVSDFPIALLITRNFCTCDYVDFDLDGIDDPYCECLEYVGSFPLLGDIISDSGRYQVSNDPYYDYEPAYVGDDAYLCLTFDWNTMDLEEAMSEDGTLRINGVRFDFPNLKGSDADRNNFDVCEVAFFRNVDEATAYFEAYIDMLSSEDTPIDTPNETEPEGVPSETEPTQVPSETEPTQVPSETEPTQVPSETEPTQVPSETEPTQVPSETEPTAAPSETEPTAAPSETESTPVVTETPTEEKKTEAPTEEKKTEAPTSAPENETDPGSAEGGCGSVVGVGAIAIVAIAAAGLVSFKKKED